MWVDWELISFASGTVGEPSVLLSEAEPEIKENIDWWKQKMT